MDLALQQMIYAALSIIQGVIFTALWIVVFVRTQHRGAWFFVPLLPLIGVLVVPIVLTLILAQSDFGINDVMAVQMLKAVIGGLFSVAPLAVLAVRLLNGQIRIQSVTDSDVFGG